LKIKMHQLSITAVLSFALVMFSAQGLATAAPTLKAQLQTLIKKANATWPKIGSYRILDNNYGQTIPTEIYFYNNQLEYKELVPGYGGSIDSQIQIFEPFYSYTPFPKQTVNSILILEKLNVKRIDWTRYTGGYSKNEPYGYVDSVQYRKYFTWPLSIISDAASKSKSVSLNAKSKTWAISGLCDHQKVAKKCSTNVSFNPNGSIKKLSQDFIDGYQRWFLFDTTSPTEPFVDHAYVIDRETGMLAEF